MTLSYADGVSATPLLGETIGDNLARTAAAHPDADALVSCHQGLRWTYAELDERVDRAAAALIAAGLEAGDRLGIWSPNRAEWTLLQYATAPRRDHPGQRQPGLPDLRALVRAAPVRLPHAGGRAVVQDLGLHGNDRGGARRSCPSSSARSSSTPPSGTSCSRAAARSRPTRCAPAPPRSRSTTRSTSSTRAARPASPRARRSRHHNILNNGYFVAECLRLTGEDRLCIPVPFYHCFGQVMGNLGCTSHGACMVIPEAAFEPAATLRAVAGRALHRPLRRAHDVHRRARADRLRRVRPEQPAHRDHGRLAVPGRGDAAGHRPHAHGGRDHLPTA